MKTPAPNRVYPTLPRTLAFMLVPLAIAGCAQAPPQDRPAPSPAARVTGPAESCVPITMLRDSRVRDDWTIDFMRGGKRAWRVTLPNRCPGLRSNDGFTYETSLTRLCDTDIIYVLQRVGGSLERGAGCGLGAFVPVELDQ